jgi:hypothetical protein
MAAPPEARIEAEGEVRKQKRPFERAAEIEWGHADRFRDLEDAVRRPERPSGTAPDRAEGMQ